MVLLPKQLEYFLTIFIFLFQLIQITRKVPLCWTKSRYLHRLLSCKTSRGPTHPVSSSSQLQSLPRRRFPTTTKTILRHFPAIRQQLRNRAFPLRVFALPKHRSRRPRRQKCWNAAAQIPATNRIPPLAEA